MKRRIFALLLVLLLCGSMTLSVSADIAEPMPSDEFIDEPSTLELGTVLLIVAAVLVISAAALVLILILVKKRKR